MATGGKETRSRFAVSDKREAPPKADAEADEVGAGGDPEAAGGGPEPEEATLATAVPDPTDSGIHDLSTAPPSDPVPDSEPAASPPAADLSAEGPFHGTPAEAVQGAPIGSVHPDTLRVPPPQDPPRPILASRMRAIPGRSDVVVLDDEDAPEPLALPVGSPFVEAERCLAAGDLDGARAAVAEHAPPLPEPGAEANASLSDDQIAALGILCRAALMEGDLQAAAQRLLPWREHLGLAVADAAFSLAQGQVERAERRIKEARAASPRGLVEAYTQALVEVARGEMRSARELLEEVARSEPGHAVARHQLGQLVLAGGDPARAGTLFEMAIEIAPGFVPPALSLAEMLADSRQYGEAMQLLSQLCEDHPGLLAPRLQQLKILLAVGDVETAHTLAEALKGAAPGQPEVVLLWAETQAKRGALKSAQGALEGLLDGGQSVRERALRLLAQIELASSPPRFAEAVARLEDALKGAPNNPELILEVAQVHLAAGDMTSARQRLEKLTTLHEVDLGVLLSGAVAAQNHGLFRTAIDLASAAQEQVRGTPAEGQIGAFIAQMQGA